jgi:hypothetical protein
MTLLCVTSPSIWAWTVSQGGKSHTEIFEPGIGQEYACHHPISLSGGVKWGRLLGMRRAERKTLMKEARSAQKISLKK